VKAPLTTKIGTVILAALMPLTPELGGWNDGVIVSMPSVSFMGLPHFLEWCRRARIRAPRLLDGQLLPPPQVP
jgi:hypothetical protein